MPHYAQPTYERDTLHQQHRLEIPVFHLYLLMSLQLQTGNIQLLPQNIRKDAA